MNDKICQGLVKSVREIGSAGIVDENRAGESGGRDRADPPLLIGGSKPEKVKIGNLHGVKVDYLTITVGPELARYLVQNTELSESYGRQQGFKKVEVRNCWGDVCNRRYDPISKSKRFGFDYESWSFGGQVSNKYSHMISMLDMPCYATRLDCAYDYKCEEDFYPADFIDLQRKFVDRFNISSAGDEKKGSRYVGARESGSQVRIYRKDLEDKIVEKSVGPMLRIELEAKKEYARILWEGYKNDGYRHVLRLGAARIKEMTGAYPLPDDVEVPLPDLEKRLPTAAIETLYHLFYQYGPIIATAKAHGVDLEGLSQERALSASKASKSKHKRFMRDLAGSDVVSVNQALYEMLGSSGSAGSDRESCDYVREERDKNFYG